MIEAGKHASTEIPRQASLLMLSLLLHACSSTVEVERDRGPRAGSIDVSSVPDAVPRDEPRSRYGNPPSYVVNGKTYHVLDSGKAFVERGVASWYGEKFHGRRTSSGEPYDMYAMTAAHKSLPLPTYVEVMNVRNGKKVVVKVNDRGPFHANRIIDLSYTAAAKLDILEAGTGLVEIRSIDPVEYARSGSPTVDKPAVTVDTRVSGFGDSGFYIQVGAYSQLVNAMKMRDKLGSLREGLLNVSEAVVNGGPVYRVRIGPISDISMADRIVLDLRTNGVDEHYITLE